MRTANVRWHHRRLARVLHKWHSHVTKGQDENEYDSAVWAVNQRQRHRLVTMARQVVRRWMFVEEGRAFRAMDSFATGRKRMRSILTTLQDNTLRRYYNGWIGWIERVLHVSQIQKRTVARLLFASCARAFSRWVTFRRWSTKARSVSTRLLKRWHQAVLRQSYGI